MGGRVDLWVVQTWGSVPGMGLDTSDVRVWEGA